MKRVLLLPVLLLLAITTLLLVAQSNLITITASKISTDPSGALLAQGKICFQATDSNSNPLNFGLGGGGQVLARPKCSPVVSGAISGTLQVASPATSSPPGIAYTITVYDTTISTTVPQLTYRLVQPTGSTWSFDSYAPTALTLPLGITSQTQPTFNLPSPATTDSGLYQAFFSVATTLQEVDCWTDQGSATVNLEVRSASSPGTTGTPVLSSGLACGTSVTTVTSLSAPAVAAGSPLALTISAVSGSPNVLHVHVR